MREKRCNLCGHSNGRLQQVMPQFVQFVVPGREEWRCGSPRACIRRMEQLGQWVGKRVLRRIDIDGTEWTIRRGVGAPVRPDVEGLDYVLTMSYRDHRLTSWHTSPDAAKTHAEDLIASWLATSLRQYDAEEHPAAVPDEPELFA